jgi:thiamine pyrophosphate-dependent acetolactate synthase large subunit-like protein
MSTETQPSDPTAVQATTGSVTEAIMRTIRAAGVEAVFGLPGVHNLAFWQCEGSDVPQIVGVRHEQTTVYAADGMARSTGGLGVALTTTGPGAANAAGAFGEAGASGSPVVMIATEISSKIARPGSMRGALHESRDQAAIFEPLAKAVFRPRTAQDAVDDVARAIEVALAWPRGPVYVDIPTDLLGAPAQATAVQAPIRPEAPPAALDAAAALIDSAEEIVIWAGGGVVQSGAEAELAAFAARLKAPVVTTFAARGVLPSHDPQCVGLPAHEPEVAALIGAADLLIGVGTDFDGTDTRNWSMPTAKALLNLNVSAEEAAKNYSPDLAVIGDARQTLVSLTDRVLERAGSGHELAALRSGAWGRIATEPGGAGARRLLDAIDAAVAAHDAEIVADMTMSGYWAGGYARVDRPRRLHYAVGWGTLGMALPMGIGPAALRERPVLVLSGDGGFMFAPGELAVIAEQRLPVTVLLVDDGGYGMLRYDQVHSGEPARGVDLGRPDFAALVRAFGIEVTCLTDSGPELERALDDALASGGPRVVLLTTEMEPPRTISARWAE